MRRTALAVLLALNLAGGLLRWANPDPFGAGAFWDLTALLRCAGNCAPEGLALSGEAGDCSTMPPYLPAALPALYLVARLERGLVESAWILGMGAALLALFSAEARRWATRVRTAGPGGAWKVFTTVLASLFLFKGTSLGFLSGQPSLLAAVLLLAFITLELRDGGARTEAGPPGMTTDPADGSRSGMTSRPADGSREHMPAGPVSATAFGLQRWVAALCLAVAAGKPNVAVPFFLYLLLRRDFAMLAAAGGLALAMSLASGLLWLGPIASLGVLLQGPDVLASFDNNDPRSMGATGRIDLAPLLAVAGIHGRVATALLVTGGLAACAVLARLAGRLDARQLLFASNALVVALLYHRDYDLPLLVMLALPLVRERWAGLGAVAFLAALPLVLPLQFLHGAGMQFLPAAAPLWNLVGCATAAAVPAWAFLLCRPQAPARA